MGGMFKKPKAPKEKEQKWEPILSPLKSSSSARNNITRKAGSRDAGMGLGTSAFGVPTMLGSGTTLGG
jgi:hypothetical protein